MDQSSVKPIDAEQYHKCQHPKGAYVCGRPALKVIKGANGHRRYICDLCDAKKVKVKRIK